MIDDHHEDVWDSLYDDDLDREPEPPLGSLWDAQIEDMITCARCHVRVDVCDTFSLFDRAVCVECLQDALDEIDRALAESVKLQSHYARLLNDYDGGKRFTFESPESWIERLRSLKETDKS